MNDLPQRYIALVARRPELAVDGLEYRPVPGLEFPWRFRKYPFTDEETESIIFRRLCEMMPPTCCLRHNLPGLWTCGNVCNEHGKVSAPDPLSALFMFWESQP